MQAYEFGNKDAKTVLLQMVDDQGLSVIEKEVQEISARAGDKVRPRMESGKPFQGYGNKDGKGILMGNGECAWIVRGHGSKEI